MAIHMKNYSTVEFFKGKDKSFIAWISTILKPISVEDEQYVYKEGVEILDGMYSLLIFVVFFLVKGTVGYVLPRLENKAYLLIETG